MYQVGEYQLPEGKIAVITHVQPQSKRMYVGYIKMPNGELKGFDWDERGRWGTEELATLGFDLPGAKHRVRLAGWVNVYKLDECEGFEIGPIHDTLQEAKDFASDDAFARPRIELVFDEGENI